MMNRYRLLLVGSLLCGLAAASQAQEGDDDAVARIMAKATAALARLEYTYHNEMVGAQPRFGQCICIDAPNGVFLTRDVPPTVPLDEMRDFTLIVPGSSDKKVKVEMMGIDPEEGFAFLRAEGPHPFKDLKFVRADLQLGQRVVSVGLLGPMTGSAPYVGLARVAAVLRVPDEIVHVSGGNLTNATSPVFTLDGRMVGLVSQQIPMEFEMVVRNRRTGVGLAGVQRTSFFVPATTFAHVLGRIPQKGKPRRLPWMGVWKYQHVSPDEADVIQLPADLPAVVVKEIKTDGPAGMAGVRQGDAIIGLNGKPLEKLPTPKLIASNFRRQLYRLKAGDKVSVTIFRDKRKADLQVTLEDMPRQPHEADRYYGTSLGIVCRNLVDFDRYPGRPSPLTTRCVLVTLVLPKSPAAVGKMLPGDYLTHVGDKPIPNVETLKSVLKGLSGKGETVQFMVKRGAEDRKALMIQVP